MSLQAIDLFAGAGGFTTGAEMAGVNVIWAANHWPEAVETHANNHPGTFHTCQDLQQADWTKVPSHDILLASPACQGHSHAKGKERPEHDASRSTAFAVVSAAEYHRPPVFIVENVKNFFNWILYPSWKLGMESLGYSLAVHLIDSADHGVPQNRDRPFIVGTQSKAPLFLDLPKREHTPINNVIKWDAVGWSDIHKPGRSKNTIARVKRGREEYGDRFVMPYYGSGSGKTGRSVERPIGTVTTRDRWAIVQGDKMRMLNVEEYRAAMGFPRSYKLPVVRKTAIHLLGNAVCPNVACDIINAVKKQA